MAKARSKNQDLLSMAIEMVESGVDYRVFHNTFFGQDSELLAGKSKAERFKLLKSKQYKQLQDMAIGLGTDQGYLERDPETDETRERRYSGSFVVRIPSSLHRQLSVEARREGVSLNQLCTAKLARPLAD